MALLALGTSAAEPAEVRNRLSVGALGELVHHVELEEGVALELLLSDTLEARVVKRPGLSVDLHVAGRAGLRVQDGRLDRARVRRLGVTLGGPRWSVELGRFAPEGGLFRLVDGVQVLGAIAGGLRLGAWAGAGPDPYTTLPAARFGGGPVLGWASERAELSLLGEVLATADGLDRLSAVLRARVEVGRWVELGGHLDVQAGPNPLTDALLQLRVDPRDDLRLDVAYDGWSSLSYLQPLRRDPWVTRFAARSTAWLDDPWVPQDAVDASTYHQASGAVAWRPAIGGDGGARLQLRADGRYRHHALADRRFARAGLRADLLGLVAGRLDVGVGEAWQRWGDVPGSETTASVWASMDRVGLVALDVSGTLVMTPREGADGWGPSLYVDAFLDWAGPRGVSVSVGYSYSNSQDLDRWSTWHGVLARVGWSFDSRRGASRAPVPEGGRR